MKKSILIKLYKSFHEMENSISSARKTLESYDSPPKQLLDRIELYEDIVRKQRNLAQTLREHTENENWEEVSRHVNLISGLSGMIKDDATDILAGEGCHDKANCGREIEISIS